MSKYQRPIRSTNNEIYDVEMLWQKKEILQQAYQDFWATLPKDLVEALDGALLM